MIEDVATCTCTSCTKLCTNLRSDWWLVRGVSKFIGGLFCRKAFGKTDYLYWIREELQKVCLYEADHTLPPLCASLSALQAATSSASGKVDRHQYMQVSLDGST